jgi:hypothetical protein
MIDTMWICDPETVGLCPCDGEQYSCSCDVVRAVHMVCANCGSPMVLINVDDGSRVTVQL